MGDQCPGEKLGLKIQSGELASQRCESIISGRQEEWGESKRRGGPETG